MTKTKTIQYTLLASILFGVIFHGFASGQGNPVHFNPVANTGQTHPILVNAATINGVPLSVGDEIAVFDGQLCAGAIQVQAFPVVFPSIMRQIVYTDTLPGAVSGHPIQFRIWDADRQSEIYGIPVTYLQGNGNFGAFITEVDILGATVIDITINTNPSNFTYYVNGLSFTTSRTFSMNVGQTFYLSVDSIPSVPGMPPGERYRLSQWASNDLQSTTNATFAYVVPASPAIATATFLKQYFLTTSEDPDEGGNVAPPPPGAWYDNSATATAIAVPAAGYLWSHWTGDFTANNDTTTVLMNAPKTITAHFGASTQITVQTSPSGRSFSADGTLYNSAQTFTWIIGSQHILSVNSPQAGVTGTRYAYASWSSGGNMTHTFTVPAYPDTVIANFYTQYLLTVNTAHGTPVGGGWYNAGSNTTFSVDPTIVPSVTGTRFELNSWTGSGSGSYSGSESSYTVTMNNPITETANWDTQYKLTVTSIHGTVSGNGWYDSGTIATFAVASPIVSGGTGIRYSFTDWTGTGTGSYSGDQSPFNVFMNNPITEAANWDTLFYLTTSENPDIGGTISPPVPGAWYAKDSTVNVSGIVAPGYQWAGWTGDLTGTTTPTTITMNGPKSVTANFGKEVQIQIQTDPPGLNFTADDTTYSSAHTFTWIENSQHALRVPSPQSAGTGIRYAWNSWSDEGDSLHTYIVPGTNQTVTALFDRQYLLTVSTAYGTPIGGGWYLAGSNAVFSVDSAYISGGTGRRYEFSSWTGTGTGSYSGPLRTNTIAMNYPITETAAWDTQYRLTVTHIHGTATGDGWYDVGTNAAFSLNATTVSGGSGIRYTFTGWTGTGTGQYTGPDSSHVVPMNNAITETASWDTLYYLTTAENPDVGGTITPTPPGGWYSKDAVAPVSAAVAASYQWAGWSGDLTGITTPTTITMDGPKTVTANFGFEVQVRIKTDPINLNFIADGVPYTAPQNFLWIENSQHTLSAGSPQSGGTGIRYRYTSWSDDGDTTHVYTVPGSSDSVAAYFQKQVLLTLNSAYGSTSGQGWYDAGEEAAFSVSPTLVSIDSVTRQVFKGWTGSGYTGSENSHTVTMNNPITETANWQRQFKMTVVSAYGTATGDGWYDEGAFAIFTVGPTVLIVENGIRHLFSGWTGTFSGPDSTYTVQMNSAHTETAQWLTQYFLSTAKNPVIGGAVTPAPPGEWYNSGSSPAVSAVPSIGYQWAGWSGHLTGTANPTTITMNAPKSITANFGKEVSVTVRTQPEGFEFWADGANYSTTQTFTWIENSAHTLSVTVSNNELAGTRDGFTSWSDGGDTTHTYTVPVNGGTVIAYFQRQHLLTINSAYSTTEGGGWYIAGSSAAFYVDPFYSTGGNTGYGFTGWTGTGTGSYTGIQNPYTVTMNNPITETATWSLVNTVTLTATVLPDSTYGTVTVLPEILYQNARVTLSANPEPGYVFDRWSGAVTGTNSTTQFTITADDSVTAHFVVADTADPFVYCYPPNGAVQVPRNNGFEFLVLDSGSGIDLSTLNVWLTGALIVQNGAILDTNLVSVTAVTHGYYVVYAPAVPFSASTSIAVRIRCLDRASTPNILDYSYSFTTGNSEITMTSKTIVPTSGASIVDTSGVTLLIPSNALSNIITISIGFLDNVPPLPDSVSGVGFGFHFAPEGLQFNVPITVIFKITEQAFQNAGVASLSLLRIYHFFTSTGVWEHVPAVLDSVNMTLTVQISHFSIITLAAIQSTPASKNTIINYPNPFNPEESATNIMYQLKEDAKVTLKIYDVSGRVVRILEENEERAGSRIYRCIWDGKNGNGTIVANNVYYGILILNNNERLTRKIAVLR